jgi:hypothetical protein
LFAGLSRRPLPLHGPTPGRDREFDVAAEKLIKDPGPGPRN